MTLKLAQVGMGRWGRNWALNAIPDVREIETVAWVDADADALELAKEELALDPERCFLTMADMLSQVDVDGVLITAALPGHVPVARAALEAGKHVLTEKPFAPSVAEAQQLVDLADRKGLVLMVSQNYRYFPAPMAAARLVREESVGALYAINLIFRRLISEPTARHANLTQPLLMDMTIHHYDLLRMVTGSEPHTVYCYSWHPPTSRYVDPPAAAMVVQFNNGVVATYQGSWVSTGPTTPWAGEWRMECAEGEIMWTSRGDLGKRLEAERVQMRKVGGQEEAVPLPKLAHSGRAGSLARFAQTISEGKAPDYTSLGSDNIGSLRFMDAAIESAAAGRPVTLS